MQGQCRLGSVPVQSCRDTPLNLNDVLMNLHGRMANHSYTLYSLNLLTLGLLHSICLEWCRRASARWADNLSIDPQLDARDCGCVDTVERLCSALLCQAPDRLRGCTREVKSELLHSLSAIVDSSSSIGAKRYYHALAVLFAHTK